MQDNDDDEDDKGLFTGGFGGIYPSIGFQQEQQLKEEAYKVKSKQEIYTYLRRFVSGQESVLDRLAFTAYLYTVKMRRNRIENTPTENLPRINFLLTGPTGCGKTYIVKNLAKYLGGAYHRIDCSSVTGEGWLGTNISSCIEAYAPKAITQIGIIHLDEFDKLAGPITPAEDSSRGSKMYFDKQANILDLLDSAYSTTAPRTAEKINNAFVIMTGSFQSFREQQKKLKSPIGFSFRGLTDKKLKITDWKKALSSLGFIPELSNRIITSCELEPYTRDQIKEIMTTTENSAYRQYQELCPGEKYTNLTNVQIESIIDKVYESKSGMREIESLIFEEVYKGHKDEN